jgi:hypothetical protein
MARPFYDPNIALNRILTMLIKDISHFLKSEKHLV